ncbi:MAG TPA: AI-2E family transporter [Candidatus Limnocylindria bacterium]|jgi:predicted PurR-regulated permease PerM|nr:AI-2E family transporter [Candidatus Limnocylindria bacterium]
MEWVARHRLGLFVAFAIAVVLIALWLARSALPVFGIAIALAFLLDPPVTALQRRRVPRLAGILIVYVVVIVVVVGLGWLLLPPLFEQLQRFLEELPTLASQLMAWEQAIVDWLANLPLPDPIREALDTIIASGQQTVIGLLEAIVGPLLSFVARTAGFIVGLVVVPVWLLYVLKDRERLPDGVLRMLPVGWRTDTAHAMGLTTGLIGRWIRGQILLGAVIFTATLIGLLVLALIGFSEFADFAVLLALVAGILEFVPIIGPIIAAVPAVLIGASISPAAALAAIALYTVVQQLENHLLVPKVMGDAVDLHPAVVILSLIMGASLFGLWGAILAAPVVALARDLYRYIFRRLEGGTPDEARTFATAGPAPEPAAAGPPPGPSDVAVA